MTNTASNGDQFARLGVAPHILAILAKLNFVTPTPIQAQAIMPAIEGKDIVGIAQTGTGKTLAFAIPMIQRFTKNNGLGLVVAPTRELAMQIETVFQSVGQSLGIRTALLIGGASMFAQMNALRRRPHIIICTPGRMNDHLNQKTLTLHNVSVLVLDEADHMFDMGFLPQITRMLQLLPRERQTLLFSATMPNEIFVLATHHMRAPVRIEIARAGTPAERVAQEFFIVGRDQKVSLLEKLLFDHSGSVLIFCRMKFGAKRVCATLRRMGHAVAEIHSNRSLSQRREALDGFKSGKYRVLVATDIAARGIDVTGISLVINFDLPQQAEDYVHRIGRTGRAGMEGKAISFAMPNERGKMRDIERLIRVAIRIAQLPADLPPSQITDAIPDRPSNFRRGSPAGRPMRQRRPYNGYGKKNIQPR